jgi:ATP-dependent exoDNAse (exonuclease V) beta subunit
MPTAPRIAIHPKGKQVQFFPEPHHYLLDGEKINSVTTLIKQWFPQFDAEAVAKKKALREGRSYEALLAEWSRKRDEAANFGTKVHLMAEKIIQETDVRAADHLAETDREKVYLATVKEALERIGRGYDFVEAEKIVFSPAAKVAGTVDLLLRSKSTGEFVVGDWKTNREIKYSGFRNEMGLGPCRLLENCNFNHYSLQASAYGALLTQEGYVPLAKTVRGVLLHLIDKGGGRVVCEYVKTKNFATETRIILAAGQDSGESTPPVTINS